MAFILKKRDWKKGSLKMSTLRGCGVLSESCTFSVSEGLSGKLWGLMGELNWVNLERRDKFRKDSGVGLDFFNRGKGRRELK